MSVSIDHEHDYSALLDTVRETFERRTAATAVLFTTDAKGLFELYLDALPADRQIHNCSACKRFIERYGGLVSINEDGVTAPVLWDNGDSPTFYADSFGVLANMVSKARVTGLFLDKLKVWGTPETGKWRHIAVTPKPSLIYRVRHLTPGQAMAASRENYRTVATALGELKPAILDEALRLLRGEHLRGSERFIGPVEWLRNLHDRPKGRIGENLLWRAVALAPEGYCHQRASVVGTLLEDIAAGLSFDDVKRRFDAKLAPLMYQRPQAAPTSGNIKQAEEMVAKLGIEPSLHRRFARLDELSPIWTPREVPPKTSGGVFGHLAAKGDEMRPMDLPAQSVTWDKFARTILPSAERIELYVPYRGPFIAVTTAVHADAPPILKWDRDDERNPLAWYCYPNGSSAVQWNLSAGGWTTVTAISPLPTMLGSRPMLHEGEGMILVLEDCRDTHTGQSNALFPQCLRQELHAVRATIEAYSKAASLGDQEEASACGFDLRKGGSMDCVLRITTNGGKANYRIDRWD